eukprot:Skav219195  [mRNA]  locus=scaffold3890:43452:50879:- [translate_table: standard]
MEGKVEETPVVGESCGAEVADEGRSFVLETPMVGGASALSLKAGGAAGEEVQPDSFSGAGKQFSKCGQRLLAGVRQILSETLKQTLSLRQVGPCLLQCISFCCKPSSMAGEPTHDDHSTSPVPTVSTGSVSEVWGHAVHLALEDMSGESQRDKASILSRVEVKKSVEQQLQRFDVWDETYTTVSFGELFQSRGVDYSGDMVRLAQPLCWQAVANSLPEGVGRLKLEDFCVAGTRHYVLNFEEYLLPIEHQVPPKVPRVQVEEGSWELLCKGLVERGICEYMPISELHSIQGEPLMNGLFAVGKGEYVDGLETQRLIMNLTAANSICKGLQGDMCTLPTLSNLNVLTLDEGQEILVSSEDIRCFFYLFQVPRTWRKYLGFSRRVADHLLPEHLRGTPCVLSAAVLPMGFCNSVSIAQHVHRNVTKWAVSKDEAPGGGECEVRRDKPFPAGHDLYRIYLDNFDQMEIADRETASIIRGTPSPKILAMRQAYEQLRLPRHPAKAVARQVRSEVQGALILGDLAVAIPKPQKILQYSSLGLELLRIGRCTLRELQVVVGGFVYMATFRRPVLGSLHEVWRFMESFRHQPPVVQLELPELVVKEVVRFLCLVPLCQMFFGSKLSPMVSCSDASQTGGGLCSSQGLTPYGARAALSTIRGDVPEDVDWVQVLSVGLFDGIAALRVACDTLNLPMCGHISIEQNKASSRVVESYFPDTVFHEDICTVDMDLVRSYALKFPSAGLVLIGAGPPCQGVSALNADKRGALRDHRSVLFKEVPRVVGLFKLAFPWAQVKLLMENVASMSNEDCGTMSAEVELQAWEMDSLGFALCRRPRLYWCDWELIGDAETEVQAPSDEQWETRGQVKVANKVNPTPFLEEGWQLAGEHLPTFTTAIPSSVPGRKPAGLERLTPLERSRWEEDHHTFPPYQYAQRHGLTNPSGQWRLPSVGEREVIMGFPLGYTKACLPKSQQRGLDYTNLRLTLLGNSWQVGVIVWLISQLCGRLGLCDLLTPSQIVSRLTPGQGKQLQGVLLRPPLQPQRSKPSQVLEGKLVRQLLGIASVKGEDLMLQGTTEPSAVSPGPFCEEEMGKVAKHVEGRTERDRAKVRRTLGPLKNLTVQPRTRTRYEAARTRFYRFLEEEHIQLPRRREQLDSLVAEYIEHLWISGKGRALASDTVAGLQDLDPRLKGSLALTWRLLKTWSVNEIPARAPTLPEAALHAMVMEVDYLAPYGEEFHAAESLLVIHRPKDARRFIPELFKQRHPVTHAIFNLPAMGVELLDCFRGLDYAKHNLPRPLVSCYTFSDAALDSAAADGCVSDLQRRIAKAMELPEDQPSGSGE